MKLPRLSYVDTNAKEYRQVIPVVNGIEKSQSENTMTCMCNCYLGVCQIRCPGHPPISVEQC